jgi:hypothetical protein
LLLVARTVLMRLLGIVSESYARRFLVVSLVAVLDCHRVFTFRAAS